MVRRPGAGLVAVVLAISLATPPAAADASSALYVISGTVTDGGGRGRAGVEVTDGSSTVVTGPSGAFRFEASLPGARFVTARTPNGSQRTQVIVLVAPGETIADFAFPYGVWLWGPDLWDPMSTASGPVTRSLQIVTDAPDPGVSGSPGQSCVAVHDSRTDASTPASFTRALSNGLYEWNGTLSLPASTTEGSYGIDMIVADCASGIRVTADDSSTRRPYTVDNTPPSVSDASPSGWADASPRVSARVVDAAGSLHPDIDDGCYRPVQLWVDGVRRWEACFERQGDAERLEATVGPLAHGAHAAEIRATDDAGNAAPTLWFPLLIDAQAPTLTDPTPVGVIANPSPTLSVAVNEPDSGVDPSTVAMSISNGLVNNRVHAAYSFESGRITYDVPAGIEGPGLGEFPLVDGRYTVLVEVSDAVGNRTSLTWSFDVRALVP